MSERDPVLYRLTYKFNFSRIRFDVLGCGCSGFKIQVGFPWKPEEYRILEAISWNPRLEVSYYRPEVTGERERESWAAISQVSDLFSVECGSIICSQGVISESNFKDLCSLNELTLPGLDWLVQWFKKCRCRRPAGSSHLSPLLCDTLQPAISPIKWTRTESKDDEI